MPFSSTSAGKYDAIIVGAGHNGLVTACFLQRAGLRVLVVEKNPHIGGAAVSLSLTPGWTYSNCSYVCFAAAAGKSYAHWNCRNSDCRSYPMKAARPLIPKTGILPISRIMMRCAGS
ncbi:MAG: FAD-dependent oxidoreductase [Phyllobacteriaceae bacterium]|nr:FAD-dependent oxidoreductase [Phyllobacteriaceae bacterium]